MGEDDVESIITDFLHASDKTRAGIDAVTNLLIASGALGTERLAQSNPRARKKVRDRVVAALID